MENKYFTPDITDIRVGYEFEELGYVTHNGEIWHKRVVEEHEILNEKIKDLERDYRMDKDVRTFIDSLCKLLNIK